MCKAKRLIQLLIVIVVVGFIMGPSRDRYGPILWRIVSGGIEYSGGNVNISAGTLTASGALSVGSIDGESITDNTIDEDPIDWGTGAKQVSATDMPDFGTMTQTANNMLVSDGTDFESLALIAYENALVFYENEIVTY